MRARERDRVQQLGCLRVDLGEQEHGDGIVLYVWVWLAYMAPLLATRHLDYCPDASYLLQRGITAVGHAQAAQTVKLRCISFLHLPRRIASYSGRPPSSNAGGLHMLARSGQGLCTREGGQPGCCLF